MPQHVSRQTVPAPRPTTKEIVGANLRAARTKRRWTQHEVGVEIGATGPDVGRWERGVVEPGPTYRQALADLLFDGDLSALYESEGVAA